MRIGDFPVLPPLLSTCKTEAARFNSRVVFHARCTERLAWQTNGGPGDGGPSQLHAPHIHEALHPPDHAFSKKLENLASAVAIHVAVYNFVRMHGSLKMTPAMAAGVVDKLWSMDDLYDAVIAQQAEKKKRERYAKLMREVLGK